MNTAQRVWFGVFLAASLGCATSQTVIGKVRPPLSPAEVQIYVSPPTSYETIAILSATDYWANPLSEQSRMNKVMSRLKASAAKVGANGVLLQGIDNTAFGPATQINKGRAIAIYVPAP